jgi:2'-hydroxyisoflavone reductase
MLAPGTPHDPIQVIDLRDLTRWMMNLVESRRNGCFNAVSPPRALTMGALISTSQRQSPHAGTRVTWVPEDFLAVHWKADELDLPPWSPTKGDTAGASLSSVKRALESGLWCRPLGETVRDTLLWFQSLPPERPAKLRAGLDSVKEAQTLRDWHSSGERTNA